MIEFKTKFLNIFRNIFRWIPLERFLRKLTSGKSPNNFFCKLVPQNYQYPKNSFRLFEYKSIKLEANIYDYVGHYLYFGFEDKGHDALMNLVKKDTHILDIGTNIGSTILQFASKINSEIPVYGFEPDTENYKNCCRNIALNPYKNIIVNNFGLGNEEGKFHLSINTDSNRGGNRIVMKENESSSIIAVLRMDDWVEEVGIKRIDLIKIDVEGFEMKVLEGGKKTITKFKPTMFIEMNDTHLRNVGNSAEEMIVFLQSMNYSIIDAANNQEVNLQNLLEIKHTDIIAKPIYT